MFLVGILVRRAPPITGVVGLLLGPLSFWLLKQFAPGVSFVNRASYSFLMVIAAMVLITVLKPLAQPIQFQTEARIELSPSRSARVFGVVVVVLTLVLYVFFW